MFVVVGVFFCVCARFLFLSYHVFVCLIPFFALPLLGATIYNNGMEELIATKRTSIGLIKTHAPLHLSVWISEIAEFNLLVITHKSM